MSYLILILYFLMMNSEGFKPSDGIHDSTHLESMLWSLKVVEQNQHCHGDNIRHQSNLS